MHRSLAILAVLAAGSLGPAAAARAAPVELGATSDAPPVSCPDNDCTAIGRVTGYQASQQGGARSPFRVRRAGTIVAFTLTLGKPNETQAAFFRERFGGTPRARLSILRPGRRREHRLVRHSAVFDLSRYLGSSPTFALRRPLPVAKGDVVALTIPTWAPAFSVNLTDGDAWRASRAANRCAGDHLFKRAAQQRLRSRKTYGCLYRKARLRYSATFVADPEPTS